MANKLTASELKEQLCFFWHSLRNVIYTEGVIRARERFTTILGLV